MKLLALTFRNLNSLRGDHTVSFVDGPLARAGLFAITGPTGAGKTTILDAITLALYGRAARYERQQPVDMMTRHTGECFAEAHFECNRGAFGARWELRRSRGKPDGSLQPVKRCLYELTTKEVVADKIKDVDDWIATHTGLDYQRFLRSVLLAQGEFTAFLRASEKDRGQLLENLTGMEIYAELSRLSYQLAKEKRQTWTNLEDQLEGFAVLSSGDRENLERQLERARQDAASLRKDVERCRKRQACVEQWQQLQDRKQAWTQALRDYEQRAEQAEDRLARLALHQRTEPYADRIRQWKDACRQTDLLGRREIALLSEDQRLEEDQANSSNNMACAREMAARVSQRLGQVRELLEKVMPIDERIRLYEERRLAITSRKVELAERLSTARENLTRVIHRQETLQVEATSAKAWLAAHEADNRLISRLPEWERRLEAVESLERRREESLAARTSADGRRRQIEDALRERRRRIEAEEKQLVQTGKAVEALTDALHEHLGTVALPEWEGQQRSLQEQRATLRLFQEKAVQYQNTANQLNNLVKTAAQLEARAAACAEKLQQGAGEIEAQERVLVLHRGIVHRDEEIRRLRQELQEGEACPVCGSIEHPEAARAAPLDSSEMLAAQEAKLADLRKAQDRLREDQIRCQERQRIATLEMASVKDELVALEEQVAALHDSPDSENWSLADLAGVESALRTCESEQIALDKKMHAAREIHRTLDARQEEHLRLTFSLQQLRQAVAREEGQVEELTKSMQSRADDLAMLNRKLEEDRTALAAALKAADGTEASKIDLDLRPRLARLTGRAEAFGRKREEAEALERQAAQLARDVKTHQDDVKRLVDSLTGADAETTAVVSELDSLRHQRQELAGDRPLLIERQHFEREEERLRILREETETANAELREKREATRALLTQTRSERGRAEEDREIAVRDLRQAAETAHFAHMGAFLAAHLSRRDAAQLAVEEQALRECQVSLSSQKTELDRSGAELLERSKAVDLEPANLESPNLEQLERAASQAESALEEKQRTAWDLEESLKRDRTRRQEFESHQQRLKQARREYLRWEKLNELIGSADGSVFSRFAQGLTLAHLIELANRHLARLTDRYRLRRQPDAELAIEVVDRYQANAVRSMLSLSGGESFLASLALALGLSELAAGNASIDSLFIDEGFGTLDADSLETAIRALENLQAQQKTVGIISHTELLKERITAQIQVRKGQGGHSSLQVTELTG